MEDGQAGLWRVPGGGEDRKKEGTTEMKGGNQEGGEGSEVDEVRIISGWQPKLGKGKKD